MGTKSDLRNDVLTNSRMIANREEFVTKEEVKLLQGIPSKRKSVSFLPKIGERPIFAQFFRTTLGNIHPTYYRESRLIAIIGEKLV